jgi:hypothetical protein
MPSEDKLEPLFSKYEQGFRNESSETGGQVLGVPFLAQLAFRVIANPGPDGDRVADNPTTLLRRITEITVHHARLSTEYIQVGASPKFAERAICKKLHGDPLRRLLHRTAAKMTIAGRESVSHKELWDFLHASNDADLMEQAEGAGGISGLLIAFFFKGGNTQLGCEFTHKAFREYLFAEAVVECIKDLAKDQETTPNLGVRTHYWRDFSDEDPRQEWSRSLGELLAPQWLAPPVSAHITELLEWETRRAAADSYSEEVTQPLTPAEWKYVRDGIADVYDWWTEGVPMRPQLGVIPKKNETEWRPPYFQVLIEQQFERPSKPNILTVIPPRMTTYDGHLGAALMHLTAAIHVSVSEMVSQLGLADAPRDGSRVQSLDKGGVIRFRPTGDRPEFFKWYCSRITAAGWYGHMFPDFEVGLRFPASAYLRGVDLGETHLQGEILVQTNLREAILARTALDSSFLFRADLSAADLSEASLDKARLVSAVLKRANFAEAELRGADLEGADLEGANLEGANLEGARIDPKTLSAKQLASLKGRP